MNRRDFLLRGGVVAALGGASAYLGYRFRPSQRAARASRPPLGPEFQYNIEPFLKTDPALIKYRQTAAFKVRLKDARAIQVAPDGRVLVAGDDAVVAHAADGAELARWPVAGTPRALWPTAAGEVFVALTDHVEVRDAADGAVRATWASCGPQSVLTSIAVAGDDVFVADAGGRIVLRCDRAGKVLKRLGARDPARDIPGFVVPSPFFALRVAPDGLLRVANPGRHRVEAFTFDGDLEFAWGKVGMEIASFCGCCNPVNFALLPDGRFVTCEKGLPRVKVYSAQGEFECVVAGAESFPENRQVCAGDSYSCRKGGLDVAVDAAGRVLILDSVAAKVLVMERLPAG